MISTSPTKALHMYREPHLGKEGLKMRDKGLVLFNIPCSHILETNCRLIASAARKVLDVPSPITLGKPSRGRMIRMRVEVDLRKPLFKGFFLKHLGSPRWICFAYKGLTRLCSYCGLVGHQWKKCRQIPQGITHEEIFSELENRSIEAPRDWLKAKFKPEKPLKIPTYQATTAACRQAQIVRRDASSDEDSEDRLLEKKAKATRGTGKPKELARKYGIP
uniref:Zinc knuckle CX2CX4HX4C domain-containing protein n=1 Tax=Nelumbo nucifera TaxID=4432 RepID=A0A822XFF6_NELNU|nr:TPA_asm: hypothetical protein HUJ06_019866 [Nelumbo nucifera]